MTSAAVEILFEYAIIPRALIIIDRKLRVLLLLLLLLELLIITEAQILLAVVGKHGVPHLIGWVMIDYEVDFLGECWLSDLVLQDRRGFASERGRTRLGELFPVAETLIHLRLDHRSFILLGFANFFQLSVLIHQGTAGGGRASQGS